ncbi:MAG: ankyrin repeat domain-containing protein [Alcanivoracaceae bacterium]|nr:ankyrin repeat domain-containing protein [Alcanivoracaceae bacterium]
MAEMKREYTEEQLIEACANGDAGAVEKLLELEGVTVNITDQNGLTLLIINSLSGNFQAVSTLIKNNAEIDKVSTDGWTALIAASQNGHFEIVKLLIGNSAKVNQENNKNGCTALIVASQNGHIEVVKKLVEQKADVNKAMRNGRTALMIASQNSRLDVVKFLIGEGAKVNKKNYEGCTILIVACLKDRHHVVAELLEQKGLEINTENNYGETALIIASALGYSQVVAKLLAQKNIDIDKTTKKGWNALTFASQNGYFEIVKRLIDKGAKFNQTINENGWNALMVASNEGRLNIVKLLVENGADIESLANDGANAWMIAHLMSHTGIENYLTQVKKTNERKQLFCSIVASSLAIMSVRSFLKFKFLGLSIFKNAQQAYPLLLSNILGACFIGHDLHKILSLKQRSQLTKNLLVFMLKLTLAIGVSLLLAPIALTGRAATLTCLSIASSAYASASIVEMGIKKCFSKRSNDNDLKLGVN